MISDPLNNLILNRTFDRHQSSLKSKCEAYSLKYQLIYCEPTNKSAMYLDLESKSQIGRITVWVSGECDIEVLDKHSGTDVKRETYHFKTEEVFFETYPKLIEFMRDDKE